MSDSQPTLTKAAIVTLREITKDSVRDFCRMAVGPGQDGLVAPNAISIAQAYFHKEAWFRGIYADGTPVGFAMLEDWSQVEGVETVDETGERIFRLMLDTASGRKTKSELHGYGQNEFVPWQLGAVM